jgi:hypothetical protein
VVQKTLIDGRVYFDRERDIAERADREKEKKALIEKEKKAAEKKSDEKKQNEKVPDKPPAKPDDKPKPPQSGQGSAADETHLIGSMPASFRGAL